MCSLSREVEMNSQVHLARNSQELSPDSGSIQRFSTIYQSYSLPVKSLLSTPRKFHSSLMLENVFYIILWRQVSGNVKLLKI